MKKYFEIIEDIRPEQDTISSHPVPDKVKIEIQNDSEAVDLQAQHEPDFSGKYYTIRIHDCYHDEAKPKKCKITPIKEVSSLEA